MTMKLLLLSMFLALSVGDFGIESFKQKVCLYSPASNKVLTPLQLLDSNCPNNKTYCMNSLYKYGNFQYNGPASLKPNKGEVVMFLAQDSAGRLDFVTFLNAAVSTTLKVFVQITGADPVPILLYDDPAPNDAWLWDSNSNTGNFTWTTLPGYTDGVVIGHINFIDNYCVKSSYTQPNAALQNISIMVGNVANPSRTVTVPYVSGSAFEFCQYPKTGSSHTDATCPGRSDGTARIWIEFGPQNVQYKWFNEAGNLIASSASVTGLPAGTYQVFVNDTSSDGCTADRTITIMDGPALYPATVSTTPFTCTTKASATATPVGGSGGFTYQWFKSDGTQIGTGATIGNLMNGNYKVRVTDSCGSMQETTFTVTTPGCCGDGICQANEACGGSGSFCASDCGLPCCQPGTYKSGSNCIVCPPGSMSSTYNAASCTSCPANTFNAGGADMCAPCPANSRSSAGSGQCTLCPVGQVRASSEASCHSCGDGSFAEPCGNAMCAQCEAGTYSADGAWACSPCAPGSSSSAGASSCSTCAANSYSAAGASMCTPCPTGTTSPAGATHMLACN